MTLTAGRGRGHPMAAATAQLRGVTFTYRGQSRPALVDVDLGLRPGEFTVVLGASGAGKSTLCYCLNGLVPHFFRGEMRGEVRIDGVSTRRRRVCEWAEDVGFVFQDFEGQLFSTSVALEVAFGPESFCVPAAELRRRVAEALEAVGLAGYEDREPASLSGGQKQRLAVAAALAQQPRLLVMDEPITDLDPVGKQEVLAVARRLRAGDVTVLVAEHEVEQALTADRVVVLREGRVVADGPPDQVLTRAAWLEGMGVQPPGAALLLERLGLRPELDERAAVEALTAAGWCVEPEALERLRQRDAERASRYGPVILEVRDLEHRYPGGRTALRGVNLTVRAGEFVAVVGPNGSGKTTLVKHLAGLLRPTAGEVRVAGSSVAQRSLRELSRTVGYVFQNPDHQLFAETVFDEVAFGLRNQGLSEREVRTRVAEALAAVGLEGREGDDPFRMTRGERQRVAVASVLALRPPVLILDEPTTGLDHLERERMMDLVQRLNDAGHTVIMVTHAMDVVARYAHRTVVVQDGRILLDGPTRAVLAREAELGRAHLRPPQLVRMANRLGVPLLTVDEWMLALRPRGPRPAAQEVGNR